MKGHAPTFVALTSRWCPICQDLKPTWEKLEKTYENSTKIVIATISCDEYNPICKQFPDFLIPSIYTVNSFPKTADVYSGATTFNELSSYIEKLITPSFFIAQSKTHFLSLVDKFVNNSLFIINTRNLSIVQNISNEFSSFQSLPCHLIQINFSNYNEITNSSFFNMYIPFNRTIEFSSNFDFNTKSIHEFISDFAYPPISPFSMSFFSHAKKYNQSILMLSENRPFFGPTLVNISKHLPPKLHSCILFCYDYPGICKMMLFSKNHHNIAIYNPNLKYRWSYNGKFLSEEIINWVNKVHSSTIPPAGSGAGIFGFFNEITRKMIDKGPIALGLFSFLIATLIIVFSIGCVQSVYNERMMRKLKKNQ